MIGCGDIAGGYDEKTEDETVLSHAGAYRSHPGFRVAACVDPDEERRRAFMDAWDVPEGYDDLDICLNKTNKFDVASVCAPTPAHGTILERLLDTSVRAVFCEKPMTADSEQARSLVTGYEKAGKLICVNYMRRWDPEMTAIRDELAGSEWGEVRSVACFYAKGLRHAGSHMIDLLQFLLGPLMPRLVMRRTFDFADRDPTTDAVLTTATGAPVYLIGGDSNDYARFEAIVSCQKGVIEIGDSGFRVRRRRVEPHRHYPDRTHLDEGTEIETGLTTAIALAVDNLHRAVTEDAPLSSDARTALSAETVCDQLNEMPVVGDMQ